MKVVTVRVFPLFWVAPIVGAVLGALIWKTLLDVDDDADGMNLRDVVTSAMATARG